MSEISVPRQRARTRGFACGAPRLFSISPDGRRVVFVRSRSGTDAHGLLWELDAVTGEETLLADPAALHDGDEELSWEEKARRERMRETTSGIVGYSTDDAVARAVFMLSGGLYAADLVDVGPVKPLEVAGPVLDPRLSPDGEHVAYVAHHRAHRHHQLGQCQLQLPDFVPPIDRDQTGQVAAGHLVGGLDHPPKRLERQVIGQP